MKPLFYICIAVIFIGFGAYREFGLSGVSATDRARCEEIVRSEYASSAETIDTLIPKCVEPGMVAMMDAQRNPAGAQAAASAISAANQRDYVSTLINCALIGAGIGALGAAIASRRRKV